GASAWSESWVARRVRLRSLKQVQAEDMRRIIRVSTPVQLHLYAVRSLPQRQHCLNCGSHSSPRDAQAHVGPLFEEKALRRTASARAASLSRTTHSSVWHSAGGSSPIAEESSSFLTTARMPSASRRFLAWCTAARLNEL